MIRYILDEKSKGARVILWTCRTDELLQKALDWCNRRSIIFDAVNENLPEIIEAFGGEARKIFADDDEFDIHIFRKFGGRYADFAL